MKRGQYGLRTHLLCSTDFILLTYDTVLVKVQLYNLQFTNAVWDGLKSVRRETQIVQLLQQADILRQLNRKGAALFKVHVR